MRFFVKSISSYSSKCNIITYNIIDTNTILDGCEVTGYAPKSVELVPGANQEIPYFVANSIFGFNCSKNIKSLEKQLQAKAPKGQKRVWKAQAYDLMVKIVKLNVEVPEEEKEPVGNFIGNTGDKITAVLKEFSCIYSENWTDYHSWRHTGYGWTHPSGVRRLWKFVDGDGNILMLSSSGDVTNDKLHEMSDKCPVVIEAKVVKHEVFRGVRQTWIKNVKFNPGGLFGLLS